MDIGNCYLIFMRSMVGGYNHFELRNLERAYDLDESIIPKAWYIIINKKDGCFIQPSFLITKK